jgi:tetratricopeptide (TPR) repeat protein
MGELYFRMGRLDEAIGKYREALRVHADFYYAYWEIAYVHALKEEYQEAMDWIDRFIDKAPSPATRASGLIWRCFYLYWLGRLDPALAEADRTVQVAEQSGNKLWKVEADRMRGWIHYDKGELDLSRKCFDTCIQSVKAEPQEYVPISTSYSTGLVEETRKLTASYTFSLALLDLEEGRVDSARSRLNEIEPFLPDYFCLLHAELLLAEESPDKAITVCEKAPPWKIPYMSDRDSMLAYNLPPLKDTLARTFLKKGDHDRAIAEYERLTTFDPSSRDRRFIHPQYHYRLATLYHDKDDLARAAEEYGKFLDLWKDADKCFSEIEDARQNLARLK